MTKKEYSALLDVHGAEELANSFVFPVKKGRQKENDKDLAAALAERRAQMSEKEKLELDLLQLRYLMEDYLNSDRFDKNKSFGFFLKTYIESHRRRRKEFAQEIDINPTELSQYINDHRVPPKNIIVRLELHSNNKIPAVNWYRLSEKKVLHELGSDKALRSSQRKHVHKMS